MSHLTPTPFRSGSIAALALVVILWSATETAFAQATVYVVRHAEKVTDAGATDPALTASGSERARALAKTLRSVKLSAIYATEYQRTRLTVEPTAKRMKIEPTVVKAASTKELAARLQERPRGEAVLVAGHSNTVPDLLRALGVTERISIQEADYDDLFVVVPRENGPPALLRLHYGEFTDAGEAEAGDGGRE